MLVFINKINQLFIFTLFFIIISSAVQANNIKNSAVTFMYHKFGISKYPTTNITLDQFEKHIEVSKWWMKEAVTKTIYLKLPTLNYFELLGVINPISYSIENPARILFDRALNSVI